MYDDMNYGYCDEAMQGAQMDPFASDVVPYEKMIEFGFEPLVMEVRNNILANYGKLSTKAFEMFDVWNYKLRQDILYADKIIRGVIPMENKADLKKHLQKMNFERKISIADLATSMSPKNELRTIIKGLPQKSLFGIYNTEEDDTDGIVVDTLTSKYITILSEKYYRVGARQSKQLFRVKDTLNNRIKYYESRDQIEKFILDNPTAYKVEKVAELLNVQTIGGKKYVSVVIHRDYCRLLGRYMIVASLKAPDLHLGAYELLSLGATTVYVFAKQVKFNQRADIKYSTGAERVYYIGHNFDKLDEMLTTVTNQVYQRIKGVFSEQIEATSTFVGLEPWVTDKDQTEDAESTDESTEVGQPTSTTPPKSSSANVEDW